MAKVRVVAAAPRPCLIRASRAAGPTSAVVAKELQGSPASRDRLGGFSVLGSIAEFCARNALLTPADDAIATHRARICARRPRSFLGGWCGS
jgi:hypothetical protein